MISDDSIARGLDQWAANNCPVSVAYEYGFNEGLAAAAAEVARLKAEIAAIKQGHRATGSLDFLKS